MTPAESDSVFDYERDQLPKALSEALGAYSDIFAIVSPPRCSSTALARVFWEQPSIRYYCHEPFETTYYDDADLKEVTGKLSRPLDLDTLKNVHTGSGGRALVLKEMPYQAGENFPLLAAIATRPLVFLMRDPRSSIASRMRKKREVGEDPLFPRIESGWELLREQIDWCRREGVAHLLIDSSDFRNQPEEVFPELFAALGLPFEPSMLDWRPCPQVELDNLGGRHRHLYSAVLDSQGLVPDNSEVPAVTSFPAERDWRGHVERCVSIYEELSRSVERVAPAAVPRR